MKGRVRKNTWLERVLNNGPNLVIIEQNEGEWYVKNRDHKSDVKTTVFICDDSRMHVGGFTDGGYTGRCVLQRENGIYWENYGKYFPLKDVQLATCYMQMDSDIEAAAMSLADFIILNQIYGNILLIGYGQGGLMMYRTGTLLPQNYKTNVSVMTIATPFADVTKKDNKVDSYSIGPLPLNRNHIAFIRNEDSVIGCPKFKGFLHKKDKFNLQESISVERQKKWPYDGILVRRPELVIHIARLEQVSATKMVLSNFGQFAASEAFFSEIEDFSESHEFRGLVAYSPNWNEED